MQYNKNRKACEGEGGWRTVGNCIKGTVTARWDIANGGKQKEDGRERGVSTTYFVTEFGSRWRTNDLFYEFKELGEVEEVVTPPKRDNKGRRYGFVRFLNVKDERLLATIFDNIVLDGRKIFANVPRFNRGNPTQFNARPKVVNVRHNFTGADKGVRHHFQSGAAGISYADVLQNKNAVKDSKHDEFYAKILTFSLKADDISQYSKAFTGKIKNPGVDIDLKKIFMEEELFSIRVTLLGPNLCLLEDLVGSEIETFLEEMKGWWEQRFSSFKPWEPTRIDLERFAWIKIRGIPCHVGGESLFL